MDVAGPAVGIASLGIQICQSLLSYYDGWKDYGPNIRSTYDSITDLSETLALLKASLDGGTLDPERAERVNSCAQACKDSLESLRKRSQKLQTYGEPKGFQQKAWTDLQRAWYPLRANTLAQLRKSVDDIRERLQLALQVLQLNVSIGSRDSLTRVEAHTNDTAARTIAIEDGLAQLSLQSHCMTNDVQELVTTHQTDRIRKILDWLSPPDPGTNHTSARQRWEPQTGAWLLQSDQFRKWKAGDTRHIWIYGKAGCGKTILCSTVIEDIRLYCGSAANSGYATFYFSFSDNRKQSYENLLLSLIAQLGWKGPGLPVLLQAYEKPNRSVPGPDELGKILELSVSSFDEVFLLLDALDECPKDGEARQEVLEYLERLVQRVPNIRILATSREVREIRDSMDALSADRICISAYAVNADIRTYLTTQLSRDRRLSQLGSAIKALIEETISQKADGMFRWAYCQLQELKKIESTKPSRIREALRTLPNTLDETYERMLLGIYEKAEALVLLRWLAYAQSPPSLGELVEANIIDPSGDGAVDFDDRGGLEDVLNILSGLVATVGNDDGDDGDEGDDRHAHLEPEDSGLEDDSLTQPAKRIRLDTKVRLAHFSIKEYLESNRILQSSVKDFHLESAKEHRFLAQSCLMYIAHYSKNTSRTSTEKDFVAFPMLQYAAKSWFYHSSLQQPEGTNFETSFLSSEKAIKDWLLVHQPDRSWDLPFYRPAEIGSGLYYASFLGLRAPMSELLKRGADVNAQGGEYRNALQAASSRGDEMVVKMLMDEGADVNAQGGHYGNALQAASWGGYEKVVKILIDAGAEVNAQGGEYCNALQAASFRGYEKIVKILMDAGAKVNAQGGHYGNALQAASFRGYEKVVKILMDAGADVNAQGGRYRNALQAASWGGDEKVVKMLMDEGADVNAQGGYYGNALQAASWGGYEKVVKILIDAGAEVNAQGGEYSNALQAASWGGDEKVVKMLMDAGADVNAQGGHYSNALQVASSRGYEKVVKILMDAGADVNAQGGRYSNALQAASWGGHEKVVKMLMDEGADVNAQGGEYGNALQAASWGGDEKVVKILIDAGADVNAQGGEYSNALQAASWGGHEKVVKMLMDEGADVNAQGEQYGNALQAASWGGHEKVVKILMDEGADVNAQGGRYSNALQAASWGGHEKVVKMLMDEGADVNAQGGYYGNALQAASFRGHEKVVKMLMDEGADVNAQGGYCGNALQAASWGGHEKVVKILMDAGADVNAQGGHYGNALQAASWGGHEKVVKILMDAGAGVNA